MPDIRIFSVVLATFLFCYGPYCGADSREPSSGMDTVELGLSYEFFVPKKTSRIKFVAVLPKTIPDRQRILNIRYSPRPARLFSQGGNVYVEFIFVEPAKEFKVEISVEAELLRYDLLTALGREKTISNGAGFKGFLKQEEHVEKDYAQVEQIVKGITGRTELEIVQNIYRYVIDNMEYKIYDEKDVRLRKVIWEKKGDCSEYCDLFVALCRAKKIPARFLTGYITKSSSTPKHSWVEVYFKEYGWVSFDPTLGDVKNPAARSERFHTLKPIYIQFSDIRGDDVTGSKPYCAWWYWGGKVEVRDLVRIKKLRPRRRILAEDEIAKEGTSKGKSASQDRGVVQSILYSDESRSVVIDDEILFEGDSIYGVTIVDIQKGRVAFRKKGRSWIQEIGAPPDSAWKKP